MRRGPLTIALLLLAAGAGGAPPLATLSRSWLVDRKFLPPDTRGRGSSITFRADGTCILGTQGSQGADNPVARWTLEAGDVLLAGIAVRPDGPAGDWAAAPAWRGAYTTRDDSICYMRALVFRAPGHADIVVWDPDAWRLPRSTFTFEGVRVVSLGGRGKTGAATHAVKLRAAPSVAAQALEWQPLGEPFDPARQRGFLPAGTTRTLLARTAATDRVGGQAHPWYLVAVGNANPYAYALFGWVFGQFVKAE